MLIVKPYGRTHASSDEYGARYRRIHSYLNPTVPREFESFNAQHPELVIAQWISMIDKIISKPKRNRSPTEIQRRIRHQLGEYAFALIEKYDLLPDLPLRRSEYKSLWLARLHPYGTKVQQPANKAPADRELKGRWYRSFVGDVEPYHLDLAALAEKIWRDLYEAEHRIHPGRPAKKVGRIEARARSIHTNVPSLLKTLEADSLELSDSDWDAYSADADVAAEIKRVALAARRSRRSVTNRLAAPILHAHYARIFSREGAALSVADARSYRPSLFSLHAAVRATYRELLDGRKRDPTQVLPPDASRLRQLVNEKQRNKRLGAFVRLGKVLHYEACAAGGGDQTANVLTYWPADILGSRYLTSEGQAEIKRNEAFVRIWRGLIAMAARTLADWADPHASDDPDILGVQVIGRLTKARFDDQNYQRKANLLYGSRSYLFTDVPFDDRRAILRFALQALASVRNSTFHFKGRDGFAKALTKAAPEMRKTVPNAIEELWRLDINERSSHLISILRSLHCERLFRPDESARILAALLASEPGQAPLPRFRRVLTRAENAWAAVPWRLTLPPASNRAELQNPARMGKYGVLKLLYERAFPSWLGRREPEWINALIERAIQRASAEARRINRDDRAVSRGTDRIRLGPNTTIHHFLDQLAAITATEFRVQRGYDPDPDNAREQSKYLEDLRCDVIAQAFEAWLNETDFAFVLNIDTEVAMVDEPLSDLEAEYQPNLPIEVETWAKRLYFLLHLVPVDDVSNLLHQLRKWQVLEGIVSGEASDLECVLMLYIEMHDAKPSGKALVVPARELAELFEKTEDFDRIIAKADTADNRIPWRGLREMLRFGNLTYMKPTLRQAPISSSQIASLGALEVARATGTPIEKAHSTRELLHAKWIKEDGLSSKTRYQYAESLAIVVRHRHLASGVRFVDHVRAHRLLIKVLARLLDFAGLWERDLYFVTLAAIRFHGGAPASTVRNVDHIRTGRTIAAVRTLTDDGVGQLVRKEIHELFGDIISDTAQLVETRNYLAHFRMLRGDCSLDLTALVNATRRLMAYDRKLSNAVSRSVIEMLHREGLTLKWSVQHHLLVQPEVHTRQAQHLRDGEIMENLHSPGFVAMAAHLFVGAAKPTRDITSFSWT